jgi:ribosomal protein L37AE/L43A
MSQWPYPNGRQAKPLSTVDHPLRIEPDPLSSPVCSHCGAGAESLIRQELQVSQDGLIRRWKVRCKNCKRRCYLPHGQILKRKPPSGKILALDRPDCPDCGSRDVWRHDERRWSCRWCQRWFVTVRKIRADNTSGVKHVSRRRGKWVARINLDGKRVHLGTFNSPELAGRAYDEAAGSLTSSPATRSSVLVEEKATDILPSPAEEAAALIRLYENGECDIAEIREVISVSQSQRRCLEALADMGMLARTNIEAMVRFRDRVMERFNSLVDAELEIRACAAMPMLATPYRARPRQTMTRRADSSTKVLEVER